MRDKLVETGARIRELLKVVRWSAAADDQAAPDPEADLDSHRDRLSQRKIEQRLAEWDDQVQRERAHRDYR